ncbi:MAG: translation initiation factor IF-3 [Bacteroidetes bacterium B1(2017)]|nr:MAG: translation initiation factor IF-3 [Bacteroidetes bacterium B1(2017)]
MVPSSSSGRPGGTSPNQNRFNRGRRSLEPEHKLNNLIRASTVRLVGENVEVGVYPISQALKMANDLEMDLVEISPNADPPVCRVVDYKKFLYEQKKKKKEQKANQAKSEVKEIRFGPNTDDHDFEFKLKHAENFLKDGHKVRAFVFFKGRSIVYKERGEVLLLQLAQKLTEIAKVEQLPKLEGKKMFLILNPKGKAGK